MRRAAVGAGPFGQRIERVPPIGPLVGGAAHVGAEQQHALHPSSFSVMRIEPHVRNGAECWSALQLISSDVPLPYAAQATAYRRCAADTRNMSKART